jgi:hypothetical protein
MAPAAVSSDGTRGSRWSPTTRQKGDPEGGGKHVNGLLALIGVSLLSLVLGQL